MGVNLINKLSYGLLSLLSTQPMSGYDLTQRINKFWRSTHSAIYPLLSDLEENGYISFIFEKQTGKPDKKIYNLTSEGKVLLHEWFLSESSDEVVRDEMTLKLYCIKSMNAEAAKMLLDNLEERYKQKLTDYKIYIENIKMKAAEHPEEAESALFGSYILTQRSLNSIMLNLKWCEWIREIYEKKDYSFLDNNFIYTYENITE